MHVYAYIYIYMYMLKNINKWIFDLVHITSKHREGEERSETMTSTKEREKKNQTGREKQMQVMRSRRFYTKISVDIKVIYVCTCIFERDCSVRRKRKEILLFLPFIAETSRTIQEDDQRPVWWNWLRTKHKLELHGKKIRSQTRERKTHTWR